MRPRLLDLFCGAGGAGMGYFYAGFEVVGVDCEAQAHYPFRFRHARAVEYASEFGRQFDAIHASPPCQGYTTMSNKHPAAQSEWPQLIGDVREALKGTGLPYVIENVPGAKRDMRNPVTLHGGMFGMRVDRPRLFETNWPLQRSAAPRATNVVGVYGKCPDGRRLWTRKDGTNLRAVKGLAEARQVMGMPWADWNGIREAVPPAYTQFIGAQLMAQVREAAA